MNATARLVASCGLAVVVSCANADHGEAVDDGVANEDAGVPTNDGSGDDVDGLEMPHDVPAEDGSPSSEGGASADAPAPPSSEAVGGATSGGHGGEPFGGEGGAPSAVDGGGGVAGSGAASGGPPASGGTPPAPTDAGPPEPVVPDRPTLVVSGVGDYWRVESPLENMAGTANVTVDENTTFQTWSGFGGAFTESGWEALSLLEASERTRALELLFDAEKGAHLVWGRVPIGADGYALERYTHDEVAEDTAMESFSIERDHEYLIPYIQGALEVAPELRLWALPWTPPTWMKANGAFDRGSIIGNQEVLWAYALYLARFVEAYRDVGIEIEVLQPQADPEFEFDYPSCLWEPSELLSFVRDYLVPTLLERDVGVELWLGAFAGADAHGWIDTLMADPLVASTVTGFGVQWSAIDAVPHLIETYGWPVMQTEHKPGNFPYLVDNFNPERAPNDHGHALESWDYIRSWIENGVNSYSAWNMVLDTVGTDLDVVTVWPKSALLTVDRETRALAVTPAYHVFRHLSYFVDPGAVRIGATGADALAFENPDGAIVTVLFNPEGTAKDVTLAVKDALLDFTIPAQGWATLYRE